MPAGKSKNHSEPSLNDILNEVHNELLVLCTESNRLSQGHYFKEEVTFIGCTNPQTRSVAKNCWKTIKGARWNSRDVLMLAEALLNKGTFEEGLVGLDLTEHVIKDLGNEDILIFENWLGKYINNWALTDELSTHIVGELLGFHPEMAEKVFSWTSSSNRWMRRAAAVVYVLHGRNGRFMREIFRTAEALISDEDEMVQKGVGWMLKEASKTDEEAVVDYLIKHRDEASRLVLMYSTEKVSPLNKQRVLQKKNSKLELNFV